jgi:hypothetical protein
MFFWVALSLNDMSGLLYMTAIVVFFGWLVNCWERWSHNKNPLFFLQPCQATQKKFSKVLYVVCHMLLAVVTYCCYVVCQLLLCSVSTVAM